MTILVTHITPHLGGGVGKALATLVAGVEPQDSDIRHRILCLEQPEKTHFFDQIRAHGTPVLISPTSAQLAEEIARADIVQLEWWNHPAIFAALCSFEPLPMRLLVWCHTSGLYNPLIPSPLLDVAHSFVFTSPCSLQAANVQAHLPNEKFLTISSACGLPNQHAAERPSDQPMRVGYLGSLNFSKLHPEFVRYLAAVEQPDFRVRIYGDCQNEAILRKQCAAVGRPDLLDFRGYVTDVAEALSQLDVLAYLLNPRHYGTAENALLEAMAMGVVPVVLDNPAESSIVNHEQTGLVVHSPGEFAAAIDWLVKHPQERRAIGQRAAEQVARQFTTERMQNAFANTYDTLISRQKRDIAFQPLFGHTADAWFLASQPHPEWFGRDGRMRIPANEPSPFDLLDFNKGSAFQFSRYFPKNQQLQQWCIALNEWSKTNGQNNF